MFSRLARNLTLALCLALQAAALLCLYCPCRQNADGGVAAAMSTNTADTRGSGGCFCQASSEAQISCRPPLLEREIRLIAVTTQDTSLADGRDFVQTAPSPVKTTLPAPYLAELQVFLE